MIAVFPACCTGFRIRGSICHLWIFVDLDYYAVGRHAGGFLAGRGHHRIALLRPGKGLRGLDLAENGLREAIGRSAPLLTIQDGGKAAELQIQLDILLGLGEPVSALVATRSRQVLTVLTVLARNGKRVPNDLSLVSLDYNPYHDHLVAFLAPFRRDYVEHPRLEGRQRHRTIS